MIDSLNKTSTAYLLTGGNLGNRKKNLATAYTLIQEKCGTILQASSIYQTAAWGITNQPTFLNQVIAVQTDLKPKAMMKMLLNIEEQMGRVRSIKFGPRIIDIDILLIDSIILNTQLLKLPHPELINRRFALLPLAEIAPTQIHPVEKKSILQLLESCTDNLNVQKI